MTEQFGRKIRIIGKYFSVCVHGFLQENMIIISLLKKIDKVLEKKIDASSKDLEHFFMNFIHNISFNLMISN